MDQPVALGADDNPCRSASCHWRMAVRSVGNFPSYSHRAPLNVAGQFRHAYVGKTAVSHTRPIEKQPLGGAAYVW
jgi:hypothetical protein